MGYPQPDHTATNKLNKQAKIALLLPGSITDQSWNYVGYEGLMAAKCELGVEVNYLESIDPDKYYAAFQQYALSGFDLVIGHGSEFGDAAETAAREFPLTHFAVVNSSVRGSNLAGLDTRNEEMGYIAGYISGLLTKTKSVAFIGASQIVAMLRAEQGYHLGVEAACPDCRVFVEYIGSFDNETMGRNTASRLIARGADVIFNNDDAAGLGALRLAEEMGILAIGSDNDQKLIAPKSIITSVLANISPIIVSIINEIVQDRFLPNQVRMNGFDTGVYRLTPIDHPLVSQVQAERINQVVTRLVSKEISLPHLD